MIYLTKLFIHNKTSLWELNRTKVQGEKMTKILVQVSEPYARPYLVSGTYVTVDICKQIDFYGLGRCEDMEFRPVQSFSPISLNELRHYLQGLQHMAEVVNKDNEFIIEAPKELHALLLGVKGLKESTTKEEKTSQENITSCGRLHLGDYTETEYREYLIMCFETLDHRFVDVQITQHINNFLCACITWGIDQSLLYCDDTGIYKQDNIFYFLLTEKGIREIKS